ncbi:MAG: cytochrome c [Acidobacteria bacterium]|nr:cytochrome c [Acidobacteriota bacterium]
MKGNMPPFFGSEREAEAIAAYMHARIDTRPMGEIYGLAGVPLGRKVYQVRCGTCHIIGGADDKLPQLAGLGEQDISDLLDLSGQLGEGMPEFTAGENERRAMIEYLKTIGSGVGK